MVDGVVHDRHRHRLLVLQGCVHASDGGRNAARPDRVAGGALSSHDVRHAERLPVGADLLAPPHSRLCALLLAQVASGGGSLRV